MNDLEISLFEHIKFIYGDEGTESLFRRIISRIESFRNEFPDLAASSQEDRISEKDTILITYGDMVHDADELPLQTLLEFLTLYLEDTISTVHLLPFFPYSSDDGFSIIDYFEVNPDLGDWNNINQLGTNWRLMFDAVINHVSSKSRWFLGFLNGESKYLEYFTVVDPETDLSKLSRRS